MDGLINMWVNLKKVKDDIFFNIKTTTYSIIPNQPRLATEFTTRVLDTITMC
jgi:hypothetical protein